MTVAELAPHLEKQDVSPVEVVEAYLERIEQLDTQLHACITICREEALQAAGEAEQAIRSGQYRRPLHGVPFAEVTVLRVAYACEQQTPWQRRRPPV